jgi:hypothetical protein
LESILGRAHLMAVWKNFIKKRSERSRDGTTPAMRLGLTDERWRWERLFSRRLFPGRQHVTEIAAQSYWKTSTRKLPRFVRTHAA